MDREAWRAAVHGVAKSRTWLSDWTELNWMYPWVAFRDSSVLSPVWLFWDPMNYSMPGFPILHYLLEFAQNHVYWVSDAIQPSHPPSLPSPTALSLSQHQGLLQWVGSSHQVAKLLELHLQSFQWIFRVEININVFFFRFFSIIGYYEMLNIAPCAIQ